jgi:MYXO-CTERM domain-containing protein
MLFQTPRLIAWCSLLACVAAQAQITPGTRSATADELASLAAINRFRADPQGELSRMLGVAPTAFAGIARSTDANIPGGTAWSTDYWKTLAAPGNAAASAMDFFKVSPGNLLYQWDNLGGSGLLQPLTWNGNLGHAALEYGKLVVADAGASSPHNVAPYQTFALDRVNHAGYLNANTLGENIAPNFSNGAPAAQHAGFAVDWGNDASSGGDGIQNGAGHRTSMLNNQYTEIGIGMLPGWVGGRTTQVQQFSDRDNSFSEYLYGYAWQDASLNPLSYTYGEGMSGLTVNIFDSNNVVIGTATTDANGGYTLPVEGLADGLYAVRFLNGSALVGSSSVTISNLGLYNVSLVTSPVPEPSGWMLGLLAAVGPLALARRRKAKAQGPAASY